MTQGRGTGGSGQVAVIRRRFLLGVWLAAGVLLLWRTADLQLVQGSEWRAEAERQHRMTTAVPAARGTVLDRGGVPLALSHEVFRISVAPHEVRDTTATVERLGEVLGLAPTEAARPFQNSRRWVPLAGRHPPAVRDALSSMRGVYVERELQRFYPHGELIQGVLGAVIDEEGRGGGEQAFDEHLKGAPGAEILARDSEGRAIPGESWLVEPPLTGGQVVLTLDADLQEIAREALRDALERTGARGGDLVVTDPRSGEVLAMVSTGEGGGGSLGGINTPYEPGSTLKPFTVATLLSTGKATMADSVDTEHGQWTVAGRTITDVHSPGKTDLAHALQVSSNVAIAKLSARLTSAELYEGLRDFGFGAPTGVHLPGEVSGRLTRPQRWSSQTPASLAIGYEIGVTPIQMAMAYGALANGGTLMEPRIIRETRDSAGRIMEEFEPRAVRRVVSEDVAAEINRTLVGAVEGGTGRRAQLATFAVAGKSGTSRAHGPGGYERGAYYASFVGFFPAEAPQLVVFVKLDRPQGEYYGGATAAPVTRATMEAILAAHAPPLDRQALAAIARNQAREVEDSEDASIRPYPESGMVEGAPTPRFAARTLDGFPDEARGSTEAASGSGLEGEVEEGRVLIPDLSGVTPRTAARRLHGIGLSVRWERPGPVGATDPPAGTYAAPGDTIRILGMEGPPGRSGGGDGG